MVCSVDAMLAKEHWFGVTTECHSIIASSRSSFSHRSEMPRRTPRAGAKNQSRALEARNRRRAHGVFRSLHLRHERAGHAKLGHAMPGVAGDVRTVPFSKQRVGRAFFTTVSETEFRLPKN